MPVDLQGCYHRRYHGAARGVPPVASRSVLGFWAVPVSFCLKFLQGFMIEVATDVLSCLCPRRYCFAGTNKLRLAVELLTSCVALRSLIVFSTFNLSASMWDRPIVATMYLIARLPGSSDTHPVSQSLHSYAACVRRANALRKSSRTDGWS